MKNIIKTLEQLEKETEKKYFTTNANGLRIRIDFIGHFNNTPRISIPISTPNNNVNEIAFPLVGEGFPLVGYIIQGILLVLEKQKEDAIDITSLVDFPIRVLWEKDETFYSDKVVGFGNFIKDKFVLVDGLQKASIEKFKELAKLIRWKKVSNKDLDKTAPKEEASFLEILHESSKKGPTFFGAGRRENYIKVYDVILEDEDFLVFKE